MNRIVWPGNSSSPPRHPGARTTRKSSFGFIHIQVFTDARRLRHPSRMSTTKITIFNIHCIQTAGQGLVSADPGPTRRTSSPSTTPSHSLSSGFSTVKSSSLGTNKYPTSCCISTGSKSDSRELEAFAFWRVGLTRLLCMASAAAVGEWARSPMGRSVRPNVCSRDSWTAQWNVKGCCPIRVIHPGLKNHPIRGRIGMVTIA